MRLIDADYLKNLPFEKMIHTDWGDTAVPIEEIDNAPTVEERPQGEWITIHFSPNELNAPEKSMLDFVKCPFCETLHQGRHNFCSRCGADMRKGGAE